MAKCVPKRARLEKMQTVDVCNWMEEEGAIPADLTIIKGEN